MLIDRRGTLIGGLALACMPVAGCANTGSRAGGLPEIGAELAALEARSGGRLGVAIMDGKDGALVGHRQDERFTMCSTFKLTLAAAILARIDAGTIAADATLPIGKDDPVGHSPMLRAALDAGRTSLPILTLAEAAQVVSDNGASNILLRKLGGPEALTRYWRTLGDKVTRLDRYEPGLNTSQTGDPRDTSSAAAMAGTMRAIFTGAALRPASRDRLIGWTIATRTGLKRLRGGLPAGWRAGDKTGTNMGDGSYAGKVNDLAIVWHPGRAAPFLIAAFLEPSVRGGDTRPQDEAVLADVGRIAAEWIAARSK
jgi:beta-lactamase class A